jgi:DNA-binding MarR family transcriptional regulator
VPAVDTTANLALDAWLSVARPVETVSARIEAELGERHSICLSAYEIMTHLVTHPGWTPLSDVCRAVARSQPRISRLVTQMQDRGLVERARVAGDGRAFQIQLTPEGGRVYTEASKTLIGTLEEATGEHTPLAGLLPRNRSVDKSTN